MAKDHLGFEIDGVDGLPLSFDPELSVVLDANPGRWATITRVALLAKTQSEHLRLSRDEWESLLDRLDAKLRPMSRERLRLVPKVQ